MIFGGSAKNDYTERKNLYAEHNHSEEKADGSSKSLERSLEQSESCYCSGDNWLWNPERPDTDPASAHFREDKSYKLLKERRNIQDKHGNKTTEEKAVKTEDIWLSHGTSLIIDAPDTSPDARIGLLNDFSSASDPFQALGDNSSTLLIEGNK